jgi:capsular exopolysaccharide synthesis family protein
MQPNTISQEARLHFLDYWRVIKSRWMFVVIIFLTVLLVTTVVTFLQPKRYSAALRMKVEHEKPTVAVFEREQSPQYDPFFLQTQYEIIQSRKILDPVITRLNLQRVWATDQELPLAIAAQRLKQALNVRRFRDTSLIEIIVTDTDPRLAATIANTVADVFQSDRLEVKRDQTIRGLTKLREELDAQWQRVQEAQAKVERLRKELNVPVFGTLRLSDMTLQQIDQQLTLAKSEATSREARLQELKKLTPMQLRNTIATLINDPNVSGLLQALTESELRLEVLKQDFGPEHPSVRTEQASVEKLREQMDARLAGVLAGFEIEYQSAQRRVEELQKQLNAAKEQSMLMESEAYRPFRNAQLLEEQETKLYDMLKQRLQQESVTVELPRSPVEIVERAEPPLLPVSPRMTLNLILGAMAGLVLGVVMAFFLEFLDTSIKKVEDVEHYLGCPVLGVIPQEAGLLVRGEGTAAHLEAYRMLRTNLEFARGQSEVNSYCALSAAPGEGKSFTVANLACVGAQHGARVLVVDCDLRRPTQHQLLDVPNQFGLADYLVAAKQVDEVIVATAVPNVSVITAGAGVNAKGALAMLTSQRMVDLIESVKRRFDVVIYDTPPVLGVSDAAALARDVGTAFLVIQHRRYPRDMARRALQVVEHSGAKLLGVVVNNVRAEQAGAYFYYHQEYDNYLKAPDQRAKEPVPVSARKGTAAKSDEIELSEKF